MSGDKVLRHGASYVALPISSRTWNVNSAPESTSTYWSKLDC